MKFDPEKVLTVFTKDKAKEGDWGWFADFPDDLKQAVENEESLSQIIDDYIADTSSIVAFSKAYRGSPLRYKYFYPAPYEVMQAKWVEENDLKTGDRVKVVRRWEKLEGGFSNDCYSNLPVGDIAIIEKFAPRYIGVRYEKHHTIDFLPYFAIEKVVEEYRPFANAEEFAPYREDWFRHGNTDELVRVTEYNDSGLRIGGQPVTYKYFFKYYINADTGKPAGVKI